jgi:hypothetical protein
MEDKQDGEISAEIEEGVAGGIDGELPDWMKGSVFDDITAEFECVSEKCDVTSILTDVLYEALENLGDRYDEEMVELEMKSFPLKVLTDVVRRKCDMLISRKEFVYRLYGNMPLLFREEISIRLGLQSELGQVPLWMIGTVFAEMHAARRQGRILEAGPTALVELGWKNFGPASEMQKFVFTVYEIYAKQIGILIAKPTPSTEEVILLDNFKPRCDLLLNLLLALMLEAGVSIPEGAMILIVNDGNIYISESLEVKKIA